VVRRCVCSRNLAKEKAMAHWGAVAPKTTNHVLPDAVRNYVTSTI